MNGPTIEVSSGLLAFEAACPFPLGEKQRLERRTYILDRLPRNSIGAEIGVFRGHFSEIICRIVQPRKFYLIDPWTKIGETFGWGKEYTNFDKLRTADARDEAILRTRQFPETETVVIEGRYPDCADKITDTLDWAYIDASHAYQSTLTELRSIQNLIRPGGYILGDDWAPDPKAQHHGVYRAVHTFMRETSWNLDVAGPGKQWALRDFR